MILVYCSRCAHWSGRSTNLELQKQSCEWCNHAGDMTASHFESDLLNLLSAVNAKLNMIINQQ